MNAIWLIVVGAGAVFFAGVFMYLHNRKIWEAATLSITVALGLGFLWILHNI